MARKPRPEAEDEDEGGGTAGAFTVEIEDDDVGEVEIEEDGAEGEDTVAGAGAEGDGEEAGGDGDEGAGGEGEKPGLTLEDIHREFTGLRQDLERTQTAQTQGQAVAELRGINARIDREIKRTRSLRRKANEDGDPDAFDAADEQLYRLRRARDAVTDRLGGLEQRGGEDGGGEGAEAGPDPLVSRLSRQWMAGKAWFDPNLGDPDSQVISQLSDRIAAEGIAPSDPKHFQELDKRAREYLPHRYPAEQRRKPGPQVASGKRAPTKKTVKIPAAFVNNWRAAGQDADSPEGRKEMLRYWRESQGGRA